MVLSPAERKTMPSSTHQNEMRLYLNRDDEKVLVDFIYKHKQDDEWPIERLIDALGRDKLRLYSQLELMEGGADPKPAYGMSLCGATIKGKVILTYDVKLTFVSADGQCVMVESTLPSICQEFRWFVPTKYLAPDAAIVRV